METPLADLRQLALTGDASALRVLHDAMMELGPLAEAYLGGRCVETWDELRALGPSIREPHLWPQASIIAWETMRRVRANLVTIHQRLRERGYRFATSGDVVGRPATDDELERLRQHVKGPLPLSLEAFWAVVGSVDLRQDGSQLVHDWLEDAPGDLERLGDDDPLFVHSPHVILERGFSSRVGDGWYTYVSPDVFHTANVSGGENYHVWLPDPAADVRLAGDVAPKLIETAHGWLGQYLVDALRRSMQGGGFRGRLVGSQLDWLPMRPLQLELAAGLQAL